MPDKPSTTDVNELRWRSEALCDRSRRALASSASDSAYSARLRERSRALIRNCFGAPGLLREVPMPVGKGPSADSERGPMAAGARPADHEEVE
jgi:hypothetical protein